jgi:cephalosporin hydroxylase
MNSSKIHNQISSSPKKIASRILTSVEKHWYSRYQHKLAREYSLREAIDHYPNRNELHQYMHHYFHHLCPKEIRQHRAYFAVNNRGFGEDAFHAMWWLLFCEFKPKTCLEIGVYRGQVISLWALCTMLLSYPCNVHGISPFSDAGDDVSLYQKHIDYYTDTLISFQKFRLPSPTLINAYSTDPAAVEHVRSFSWDLIYIDGCHDYEVALADYRLCQEALRPGGILVLDDSSIGTTFHPPRFSFGGHPGPSRVLQEFAMKEMYFIGGIGHNNILMKQPIDNEQP